MPFPTLPVATLIDRLEPPSGPVRMVLDTDTYNEIDDQFAVVYSLLAPERLTVEAIYAAPFHNSRSDGPGDGMERSYEEILRLLDRLGVEPEGFVFRGSVRYLPAADEPVRSPAAEDLVERAMASEEPIMQPTMISNPAFSASSRNNKASVRPPVLSSLMLTMSYLPARCGREARS